MKTIKQLRQKLGLTQSQFSPLMQMTQQAVQRIESGARGETKIHECLLTAIETLHDNGLLEEYKRKL